MKTCRRCKRALPHSMFCRCSQSKDGLYTYCRDCQAEKNLKYKQAHRDSLAEKQARYAAEHRDEEKARRANYAKANQEHLRDYKRSHYQANREAIISRTRENSRQERETLSDRYIQTLLLSKSALHPDQLPAGLVEAKREHLRILRELRKEDHEER